ncbi:MAG: YjfK family protein [Caulobacter sp.]|nr:YjfK family protein [Caulobacter sp.]
MFDRLFGRKATTTGPDLAMVRNITIGRTLVLDPLAWRRLGDDASFRLDRDTLEITAQGLIKLDSGGYVHRFYTDDHLMFQAVSEDRAGAEADDFTLFIPWRSLYPASGQDRRIWNDRLQDPVWREDDLPPFQRYWFSEDEGRQPPVTFWEEVRDDRDGATPARRIFQSCMLYSRELGREGRELLLALSMEPDGGELTHETMVGVPLSMGEFSA